MICQEIVWTRHTDRTAAALQRHTWPHCNNCKDRQKLGRACVHNISPHFAKPGHSSGQAECAQCQVEIEQACPIVSKLQRISSCEVWCPTLHQVLLINLSEKYVILINIKRWLPQSFKVFLRHLLFSPGTSKIQFIYFLNPKENFEKRKC